MIKYAYFNGEIILEEEVVISHRDLGFLRGYGIMDAMKTVSGKVFLLEEHFERLQGGADEMNLSLPFDLQEFKDIVNRLLLQNKIVKDVAIKTIITGGKSSNGLKIDGEPTVLITLADLKAVSPENKLYEEGARVISVEFQRFSPMVKTTNYIFALQNQEKKELAEADEIIYHNRGLLLEGSTSNVFIVKDKKIITPAINILVGVTRNFVIKVLEKSEIEIEEREVKFEELLNADEVFLTGSFKNILPIIQVDDIIIGDRAVGRITKQLMKMFEENLE